MHPAGLGCHIQPLAVKESDEPGFRVLFVCRGPDDFESLVQQPRGNASSGVGDVNLRFAAQFRRHALDGLLKAFAVDVHHSYMVEFPRQLFQRNVISRAGAQDRDGIRRRHAFRPPQDHLAAPLDVLLPVQPEPLVVLSMFAA